MENISEDHIERYVRFPDTLTAEQKDQITKAITENTELRELADWFKDFYEELDSLTAKEVTKSVIPLYPIEKKENQGNPRHLIFAAMTKAPQKSSMETIATLASEEDQTVARILRNHDRNEYKVHLIRNEQPVENERTIFTIEELNMDLVIDQSRHLSFEAGTKLNELDWQRSSFSLRLPLGACKIDKNDLNNSRLEKTVQIGEQHVSIRWEEGLLKFNIHQPAKRKNEISRLIISDKSTSKLIRLNGGSDYSIPIGYFESLAVQFYK